MHLAGISILLNTDLQCLHTFVTEVNRRPRNRQVSTAKLRNGMIDPERGSGQQNKWAQKVWGSYVSGPRTALNTPTEETMRGAVRGADTTKP